MDRFQDEIHKIANLLFSNGERILETESFILEFYKSKPSSSELNWRKKIAEFLAEDHSYGCNIDILDKKSNITLTLIQLNPLKLRNLYMELLASLDLNEQYAVIHSDEHILCSVTVIDDKSTLSEIPFKA